MQLNQFILAELFSKPEILIQNALLRRKQKEGLKVQSIVFPNEYNHGKLLYFKKIAEGIKIQSVVVPDGFNLKHRNLDSAKIWYQKTIQSQHSSHFR